MKYKLYLYDDMLANNNSEAAPPRKHKWWCCTYWLYKHLHDAQPCCCMLGWWEHFWHCREAHTGD